MFYIMGVVMHVDINKKVSIMSYVFEIQQRHFQNIMS